MSKKERKSEREMLEGLLESSYSAIEDFRSVADQIDIHLPSKAFIDDSDGELKSGSTPLSMNNVKIAINTKKMALKSAMELSKDIESIEKRLNPETKPNSEKSSNLNTDDKETAVPFRTPESSAK